MSVVTNRLVPFQHGVGMVIPMDGSLRGRGPRYL